MSDPPPLVPMLPESFDGFRLELDPERQRADVILDRRRRRRLMSAKS